MNHNLILALLEAKGIISHTEAERLFDNLRHAPQSAQYNDALHDVRQLLDAPVIAAAPVPLGVGPEQAAEQAAAALVPSQPEQEKNANQEPTTVTEQLPSKPATEDKKPESKQPAKKQTDKPAKK